MMRVLIVALLCACSVLGNLVEEKEKLRGANEALMKALEQLSVEKEVGVWKHGFQYGSDNHFKFENRWCKWIGTAPWCWGANYKCPEYKRMDADTNLDGEVRTHNLQGTFGADCWWGGKTLCCKEQRQSGNTGGTTGGTTGEFEYRLSANGKTLWVPKVNVLLYKGPGHTNKITSGVTVTGNSGHFGSAVVSRGFDNNLNTKWRPQSCNNRHECDKGKIWVTFKSTTAVGFVDASTLGQGSGGNKHWNVGLKMELKTPQGWVTKGTSTSGNTVSLPAVGGTTTQEKQLMEKSVYSEITEQEI